MIFAEILPSLLTGSKVTRAAWVGGILWIARFTEYAYGGQTYPRAAQIQQMDVNNALVPWLPNQPDLEANDWSVIVQ